MITSPRLVLEVPVGLALLKINVTFCHASFSLTPELSWCLYLAAFGDLTKILPWIILNNCHKRTLCPRGKMPQQFASMLFVGSKCVNFERDPLLTFEPTTLHSLL